MFVDDIGSPFPISESACWLLQELTMEACLLRKCSVMTAFDQFTDELY